MSDPDSQGPPMQAHTLDLGLADFGCPDPLEKIFQQVEAQNERRAQQEEVRDTLSSSLGALPREGEHLHHRFGQLSPSEDGTASGGPMTPALSDIASKSPFFQAQLKNNNNSSLTSFASVPSAHAADDADADAEDDQHVTHMHTIAPRQSLSRAVGGLFSSVGMTRRLSRARSAVLPAGGGLGMGGVGGIGGEVVIGVGVATVEVASEAGEEGGEGAAGAGAAGAGAGARGHGRTQTTVHAPLRNQASRGSIAASVGGVGGKSGSGGGWAARARKFTKKFRRKSGDPLAVGDAGRGRRCLRCRRRP
ncbi:hypothetical protein C8F04DRAFT_1405656 [Mycena alexandri]|uniref:Uncharacterized protein n=1 Tax=Mycena alexandri TaxID=1745969 RepID=A0AAD6WKW9_9AGAR|nr:hypothetical protein C8F04DRAFT_1405656 [Mycena alexandri]